MSTRLKAIVVIVMLISGVMLEACGGEEAAPPASEPGKQVQPADLTPDDLLAVLDPEAVAGTFVQPETWWPAFPAFNVGFEPAPRPVDGDRFFVVQGYQQVGALANSQIETTLVLFESVAKAKSGFSAMAEMDAEGSTVVSGPAVGDQSRYFQHKATKEELDQGVLPYKATLRFRVGPLVGRVSVLNELGFERTDTLAAYFAPIRRRAEALLAGELQPRSLPASVAALLPEPSGKVGPVLGSAAVPPQSWALVDTSGDPEAVLASLTESGVTELGLRRYGLQGESDLVVEVTVYEMKDARAAQKWVSGFVQEAKEMGTLDPGATGDVAAYTSYGGEFYELQFAAGPVVGDVVCFAPFGVTTDACEAPVRAFAERWYQELTAR